MIYAARMSEFVALVFTAQDGGTRISFYTAYRAYVV